jgi:hypothetical protein
MEAERRSDETTELQNVKTVEQQNNKTTRRQHGCQTKVKWKFDECQSNESQMEVCGWALDAMADDNDGR